MKSMDTAKAIALAGSRDALASMLGASKQSIYAWGDKVPMKREWQMRVLRPDWFSDNPTEEARAQELAARMDRILKLTDELTKEVKQWRTACGGRRRARR